LPVEPYEATTAISSAIAATTAVGGISRPEAKLASPTPNANSTISTLLSPTQQSSVGGPLHQRSAPLPDVPDWRG
jgi:hypothetical protein